MGVADSFVARQRLKAAARFGATPDEFEGKAATEVHEHYDTDGNLTGRTVVTRESLWSESARERALELQRHEDSICRCGCGLPMPEAHKQQPFKVDHYFCWAGRSIEQAKRLHRNAAEKEAREKGQKLSEHWGEGLHYYAVLPDPSELREDPRGD